MIGGKAVKDFGRRVAMAMRKTAEEWPDQRHSVVATMKVLAFVLDNVINSYEGE